jgi:hypothetical protein
MVIILNLEIIMKKRKVKNEYTYCTHDEFSTRWRLCGKYVFSGSSTDQNSGECPMMVGGKAQSASKLK